MATYQVRAVETKAVLFTMFGSDFGRALDTAKRAARELDTPVAIYSHPLGNDEDVRMTQELWRSE